MSRFEDPTHSCPFAIGETITVTGLLCFTNASGGTELVENANMECEVTKIFWDYETGWRAHGKPIHEADIDRLREKGMSQYTPDWYRENRPDDKAGLARAVESEAAFNPTKVYFSEHDVAPRYGRKF